MPSFRLIPGDGLELPTLTQAMKGCEFVIHLSSNADVRFDTDHPGRDLQQNTIATFNVLEAMRANGIRRIAFSSGSIYGEPTVHPTPETALTCRVSSDHSLLENGEMMFVRGRYGHGGRLGYD